MEHSRNSRRVSEGAQYKPWLLRQKIKGGQTLIGKVVPSQWRECRGPGI